ncbi:hypothetical protein GQ44DRAFT_632126 [Phaeosphaeriaceae sp. PMI808]|nr:hypothetical protein GQ44DRAFT_632126 [Phaeosphaeriaceae sp. PMI808]
MSGDVGEGAKKLGERLLSEVEVDDLSSILTISSTEIQNTPSISFFGIPNLDTLFTNPTPPTIELVSPPSTHHFSGTGKTSLLYLIIAHAILPPSFSNIPLAGQNAAVILLDPLQHFSVSRLATTMLNHIITALNKANEPLDTPTKANLKTTISQSLLHLHIFRPQSWPSLIATLTSLPTYLFDATKHKSTHRRIHSIVLDDIDFFTSSIRTYILAAPSLHSTILHNDPNLALYYAIIVPSCDSHGVAAGRGCYAVGSQESGCVSVCGWN